MGDLSFARRHPVLRWRSVRGSEPWRHLAGRCGPVIRIECRLLCAPAKSGDDRADDARQGMLRVSDRIYHVLFLCTGNSARSILAEAQLNALGKGKFKAWSAGSFPTGRVNPFTLQLLESMSLPTDHLRSKSWDEFASAGAPVMDFVFTVCDQAAVEACPFWPGHQVTAHWGVADPAAATGNDEVRRRAFRNAADTLRKRIEMFINLPMATLDPLALTAETRAIGRAT